MDILRGVGGYITKEGWAMISITVFQLNDRRFVLQAAAILSDSMGGLLLKNVASREQRHAPLFVRQLDN